MVIESCK